jgi:hypothetical protein
VVLVSMISFLMRQLAINRIFSSRAQNNLDLSQSYPDY